MYCRNCGAQIADTANFCQKCGYPTNYSNIPSNNHSPNRTTIPPQQGRGVPPQQMMPYHQQGRMPANNYQQPKRNSIAKADKLWITIGIFIVASIFIFFLYAEIKSSSNSYSEAEAISASSTATPVPTSTPTPTPTSTPTPTPEEEPEEPEDPLVTNAKNIIINEIGFPDVSSVKNVQGTFNYEVVAGDYELMVTTYSDEDGDFLRIWIPNSKFTFYESENGGLLMTYDDMMASVITSADSVTYYIIAKEIVENNLVSPRSADFPFDADGMQKKNDIVAVQGTVNAMNRMGVIIQSKWLVEFRVIDIDNFEYETIYVNVDGSTYGEFIDLS